MTQTASTTIVRVDFVSVPVTDLHRARHFYEARGFEAIAFGDGSHNEERCPDILYEWRPRP